MKLLHTRRRASVGSGALELHPELSIRAALHVDLPGAAAHVTILDHAAARGRVDHEQLRFIAPGADHHRLVEHAFVVPPPALACTPDSGRIGA